MAVTTPAATIEHPARRRVAGRGRRCQKHAFGRAAAGSDARRDHIDVFPQVTSGNRPWDVSASVGVVCSYDPTTGVFLSPDPIDGTPGEPTEANPYHYVGNDPLNKVDPLGLRPLDPEFDYQVEILDQEMNLAGFDAARYFKPFHDGVARWIRDKEPGQRRVECFIPGGGRGGGAGFADVCDDDSKELWEVKPASDYGFRTGARQLGNYIAHSPGSRPGRSYGPHLHVAGVPSPTVSFSGSDATGDEGVRYYSPLDAPVPGRIGRRYEARVTEQEMRALEAEIRTYIERELVDISGGGWSPTPTQIGIGVGVIVVAGICFATAPGCAAAAAGGAVVAGGTG